MYEGNSCPYTHLKVYGLAMTHFEANEKLVVQTFPRCLTGAGRSLTGAALTWFTKLEIAKIKRWIDVIHLFIDQYKFNS